MQGKIFAESLNLYQDQAKILFNYYKKAAEKIVKEEMNLENSIENAKAEIVLAEKNKIKGIIIATAFPVIALLLGLVAKVFILFILALGGLWGGWILFKAFQSIKQKETEITGYQEAHRDIRRNYSIKKMGVTYVPVATKVPFEDRSFMVDHTGSVQNTDFAMSVVRKQEELLNSLSEMENGIKEAPIIEQAAEPEEIDTADYSTSIQHITLYDYMGNIDRQVRKIRYLLNDNDTVAFSLPIIMPSGKNADFISEYTASDPGDKPVVSVFNIEGFAEKIDSFYKLNDVKKDFEKCVNENQIQYFKKLIKRLAESVQILSRSKITGSSKMVDYANRIFSTVLKSAFNQYSPNLESEEIDRIRSASFDYQDSVDDYTPFNLKSSSKVKYDLFSTAWIAEDQSRTSMPFGIHQIQEEVLAPVIQNLMAENRIERLKIYNNIKDQKVDYLNQWHRDTEDFYGRNRQEAADLINRMRESLAEYMRSLNTYKALQETQDNMTKTRSLDSAEVQKLNKSAEVIAGFELQGSQFTQKQEEFSDYMDRLKDNIDEQAKEFGYIPYYEATLRDKEYRDIARSAENLQDLEPRRKKLLAINPYVASLAKLPPSPKVEQQMYDDFAIDLIKEAAATEKVQTEINTEKKLLEEEGTETETETETEPKTEVEDGEVEDDEVEGDEAEDDEVEDDNTDEEEE